MFVCNPQKLRLSQAVRLDHLRVTHEDLGLAYQLAQDFRVMVTTRHVHVLGCWLEEAKASDIKELQSLATGIYRDFDAVQAALATEYSNGQTEGKVEFAQVHQAANVWTCELRFATPTHAPLWVSRSRKVRQSHFLPVFYNSTNEVMSNQILSNMGIILTLNLLYKAYLLLSLLCFCNVV
ncbi:MAG: transposase [Ktedonobacteraceae bacterium]